MKLFWIFFIAFYSTALFVKIYQHNSYIRYLFKKQRLEYELIVLRTERNKKQSELLQKGGDEDDLSTAYQQLTVQDVRRCEAHGVV